MLRSPQPTQLRLILHSFKGGVAFGKKHMAFEAFVRSVGPLPALAI